MASVSKQTKLGKAFEYACVVALHEKYHTSQWVEVEETAQLRTAQEFYRTSEEKQSDLLDAARAAVRVIDRLEPRLAEADGDSPLVLSVQPDSAGIAGDVRDVLCIRRGNMWEIGFSCKHNHHAVKHSRLSDTIDFGADWLGHPCSKQYFTEVVPLFTELRTIRDNSKAAGAPAKWSDIPDKFEAYYVPILQSFMNELKRLAGQHDDIPEKLIRYLIGRFDFYKVITDDGNRTTKVEAINLSGTLNHAAGKKRAIASVPLLRMPTKFYDIDFKTTRGGKTSQTTIQVVCDNGWSVSMRIHSASSRVEPSLKFDVQLESLPVQLYAQIEPWGDSQPLIDLPDISDNGVVVPLVEP